MNFSGEIDLDLLDLTDYKYTREMAVEYGSELNPLYLDSCFVNQEMEELLSIKWLQQDKQMWEAPEKNKIYPAGIVGSTQINKDVKEVYEKIQQKHAQERLKQQQMQQQSARMGHGQQENFEGRDENEEEAQKPSQDADMEFEDNYQAAGYQYDVYPQSNATGGYSQNYDSNEGSDEDIN